jgi:putative membrane protein insertion efficiency factor
MPAARRFADLPRRSVLTLLRGYRLLLSPWLGNQCRFTPTCSLYAMQAVERHGAAAGSLFAVQRVLRCHPWCAGGHDPVPPRRFDPVIDACPADAAAEPPSNRNLSKPFP